MKKTIFFISLLLHSFAFGIEFPSFQFSKGINQFQIRGKVDILDTDSKLRSKNENKFDYFFVKLIPSYLGFPYIKFEYVYYDYQTEGKMDVGLKDVLKNADFPYFFGLDGIATDFADLVGFLEPIGDITGLDKAKLDIKTKIKEYNTTIYYELFQNYSISPLLGVYIKFINSDTYRKAKYLSRILKRKTKRTSVVPFIFMGLKGKLPLNYFNLMVFGNIETKYLVFSTADYLNVDIFAKVQFLQSPIFYNFYVSGGYRFWVLKTRLVLEDYQIQQQMKWEGSFVSFGVIF